MEGRISSISYSQHSSRDHITTQTPPLRQSGITSWGFERFGEGKHLLTFSDIELRFRSCTVCSLISTPIASSGFLISN
jgi:hypothetical protein